MDAASFEPNSNAQIDQYPLLMERRESHNDHEHIIDITRNDEASLTSSHNGQHSELDLLQHEDRSSSSTIGPTYQNSSSSIDRPNTRNSTLATRGVGYDHGHRSPLNSGLWISIELIVTVAQIIASVVVLSLSTNENPQAPLFTWVVGYASGCVATLPILYWRFRNHNQSTQQDPFRSHQDSFPNNLPDSTSYTAISATQASEDENFHSTELTTSNGQTPRSFSACLNGLMDHFKMALDCFFAVWFVVGNVWIFGGHSSPTDAPKLYKLCIVFLTFSCIGYAMPFILCATICCCLPCIISLLGFGEDFSQTRGATMESITSLPTYKFKLQKSENATCHENSETGDGGILAAGTEKERAISVEDAICCICLNKYADNDELRELPCLHVFHVDCVDKWLKINATCPLCKSDLGESSSAPLSPRDSGQH